MVVFRKTLSHDSRSGKWGPLARNRDRFVSKGGDLNNRSAVNSKVIKKGAKQSMKSHIVSGRCGLRSQSPKAIFSIPPK